MKIFLSLFSLLAINLSVFNWFFDSQFSGDLETFPDELYNFMSSVSEEDEKVLTAFIDAWEVDSLFTEAQQNDIVELCQIFEKRKLRPSPHYVNFLEAYMTLIKSPDTDNNYNTWVKGLKNLLKADRLSTTKINLALVSTTQLLNNSILFKSNSVTWQTNTHEILFDIQKKNLVARFTDCNLTCYAKSDSLSVYSTSGYVSLTEGRWYGEKGLVTWERTGFKKENVKAELSEYKIELKKPGFEAENVVFTNTFYFEEPLEGTLEFKVMQIDSPERATYPKFQSYKKDFDIKNLYKEINYKGGLAMHGAKLVGTGTETDPASLYLYRNDTLRLVAKTLYVGFLKDKISSQRTEVSIKLKGDSIYHPDLVFDFRVDNRELTLLKSDNFSSQSPYFNSYHAVDMNFDQLSWKMDENLMYLSPAKGSVTGRAYFESKDYFNYDHFLDIMGMDQEHPLSILAAFSRARKSETFTLNQLADYMMIPLATLKHRMMRLANQGFIFYDYNTNTITIKEKTWDYLDASRNLIDYDVIGFSSRVDAPLENGIFNLENYDLTIQGIPYVHISDSQSVGIYPAGNRIILKHNRNFQFDGRVDAGLLSFEGDNFFFSYDSFKINLQNIEAIQVRYATKKYDNLGQPVVEDVTNLIQNVTGEIIIDKEDNKSGRERYPDYPLFVSRENSYVYYESNEIEGGVYSSEDFFFQLEPFIMDSLDNYNYKALQYKGTFYSAGILPVFDKELSIQADRSLGFKHETPPEGYPVYDGKAQLFANISLDNNGLRSGGRLEYLTSTTYSDDFIMHPDSVITLANRFEIAKKQDEKQYPKVYSSKNNVLFHPYADVMYINKTEENFTMFNDSVNLSGSLELRPGGLTGKGVMDLKNSDLKSDLFSYKADEIFSDTSDFSLKSVNSDDFTVLTNNVNSHVDFVKRKAWFKANEEFTLVSFPENRYVSYLDNFEWDMDKKTLALGNEPKEKDTSDEDTELYGPRYVSLHPNQDSLNFVSPFAVYDYKNNIIDARYVKFIDVADSRIYPHEQNVKVGVDANMHRLYKSRVKTNRLTQFHNIHTASVKITSRSDYYGTGKYDYVDENDEIQVINFDDIQVVDSQTVAKGFLSDSIDFTLSPVYQYKGHVTLFANDRYLTYKGGVLLNHLCEKIKSQWFFFESPINPDSIYIPLTATPENYEHQRIYNGINMYYDSVHIYPAFFMYRKYHSDNPMVEVEGFLYYNKAEKLFKLGSYEKINDFSLPEPYMSFHRENCVLYNEGKIDLGEEVGQVKINAYGNARHFVDDNLTQLDLLMGVDFFMNNEMINYMGHKIDSILTTGQVDLTRSSYIKNMKAMLGEKPYQAMMDELNLFGAVNELPEPMKQTLIFNKLNLEWNDESNSYQSVGKIGLGSINGILINKMVDGFMELKIKRSGNTFDIYLKFDESNYWYFGYTRGVMQTHANDRTYIETIMDLKLKERKMKVGRKETSYVFLVANDRKKNNFYRRWQTIEENRRIKEEGGEVKEVLEEDEVVD